MIVKPIYKKHVHRIGAFTFVAVAAGAATWFGIAALAQRQGASEPTGSAADPHAAEGTEVEAIVVAKHVAELNGMAIAIAQRPTHERELHLRGSLAIHTGHLVHIRARFPGQIVDISSADEEADSLTTSSAVIRPLDFMDRVSKGQPMALLWSKELGEKKSELVDALANLRLDEQAYERIKGLTQRGAASEQALREAERQVQVGTISVSRAERTLRSWKVSEEEIGKVEAEVERISHHEDVRPEDDSTWASVKVVAPINGTIVEKNVTTGDIVDTATDLFKIADLSLLTLWLHAYEEDVPYLRRLPKPIAVTIELPANPEIGALPAVIDRIGAIINVTEHMSLLVGHVQNPDGNLQVGQFVTGTISLPSGDGIVEVPTRALVEDGIESLVFVQNIPGEYRFHPRRVSVVRRYFDTVHVRSQLSAAQKETGLQELHEGERVAASETIQLKAALRQKQLTTSGFQQDH